MTKAGLCQLTNRYVRFDFGVEKRVQQALRLEKFRDYEADSRFGIFNCILRWINRDDATGVATDDGRQVTGRFLG